MQLRLAPAIPDAAALGARAPRELLDGGLEEEARAEVVTRRAGWELLRIPLPGTPRSDGSRLSGTPRGGGTGWVFVKRFQRPPLSALLRARFTAPRSASLAEREWNLLCYLRANGVVTPEPLAVGTDGNGLVARRSVLVTREVDDAWPVTRWFDDVHDVQRRRLAARALGLFVRRVGDAGVELPHFEPRHLYLAQPGAEAAHASPLDACGLEQVLAVRDERAPDGLAWRKLPEVVLTSVRGGRLRRPPADVAPLLRALARQASGLSARERLAVYTAATRGRDRTWRRKLLASLATGTAG